MLLALALFASMLPTGAFAQTIAEEPAGAAPVVAEESENPETKAESPDSGVDAQAGTEDAGTSEQKSADAQEKTPEKEDGEETSTTPEEKEGEEPGTAPEDTTNSGVESRPEDAGDTAPAGPAPEGSPETAPLQSNAMLLDLEEENGVVQVDTLEKLQKAVENAGTTTQTTIQLTANIDAGNTVAVTIQKEQNIVLDLNGHTLSADLPDTTQGVVVNNGTLTVKNGTVATVDRQGSSNGVAVYNNATLIVTQDEKFTTELIGRVGIGNYGDATVLNGTIESYNRHAYWSDKNTSLVVEGGNFISKTGTSGYGYAISSSGDVTIHGGNFYAGGSSGAGDNYMTAIGMFNGGTLIIAPAEGKTVTVTSETDYAVSTMGNSKVKIQGGNFTCNGSRADIMDFESGNNVTITGGTFRHEPNTDFLGENCVVVSENDQFTVKKAADPSAVTVNSYEELAAALNGDVLQPKNITLGADVQIPADAALTLKTGYTLDVPAGKTLVLDGVLSLQGTMTNEGTLTLENDGFLEYPLQLTNTGSISNFPVVENGVCRVSTPMQLQWLSAMVEWDNDNIPARIELANDIVMPDVDFTPIGNSEKASYYKSTFDGCGHTPASSVVRKKGS